MNMPHMQSRLTADEIRHYRQEGYALPAGPETARGHTI